MIGKREILDVAGRMSLQPAIVEKDYVLGWILAGIHAHPELEERWVFKGGTCLKKCFFETYRFSEDLDFTLTDEAHLDVHFLKRVFSEIGRKFSSRRLAIPVGPSPDPQPSRSHATIAADLLRDTATPPTAAA